MQITLTGKNNLEITPALRAHADEKFSPLEEHFKQISHLNVVLMVEHKDHIAEATLHYQGSELHASATEEDMYIAIDQLVDKVYRQLQKHKEKIIDSHRQSS